MSISRRTTLKLAAALPLAKFTGISAAAAHKIRAGFQEL
jgi:uncharacterized protein (DUF1501 family)